jgi:hypothetical protein
MTVDLCVRCGRMADHTHHRKRRSQGGGDDPTNLMRLCFGCHEWVHSNPEDAYRGGYLVHSYNHPDEVPVTEASEEHEHAGKCETCGEPITKKPRKRFAGEARRTRRTISLKVPTDTENGGELWDELMQLLREALIVDGLYEDDRSPAFEVLMAVGHDWLARRPFA